MNPTLPETGSDHRSGYVALIGKPNVGKSTLLNHLMGRKLSIVTRKPQTTRRRVLGILSDEHYQIILLDTPGVIDPRYRLQESMMKEVTTSISDADLVVFMADATGEDMDEKTLSFLKDTPTILVLNKIDKIRKENVLPLVVSYTDRHPFEEVIPTSATNGFNVDVLLEAMVERLPLSPPFYPKEMISEQPERFFIAEIIREKIFTHYRKEVPYSTQVNVVHYEEKKGEKDFIDAEIIVERDSQKGILIGKKGAALKKIGSSARKDIEDFLAREIYLQLHVKVRSDWRNSETYLRSYGYST